MAIINISLNTMDPTISALAQAGMEAPLTADQSAGYSALFTLLSGKEYDPEENPVISIFGGKAYLPKLYRTDEGLPILQWGKTQLDVTNEMPEMKYSYSTYSTGYSQPHLSMVFCDKGSLKEPAKDGKTYQVFFPIALVRGEQVPGEFLGLAPVVEADALTTYVMKPNPTIGLDYLDEAVEGDSDVKVTVVNAVTLKGSEDFGGRPYTVATVLLEGKLYKVRTNSATSATLQGPLKFPLNVPGVVRRAKKNLNLQQVSLTPDNIDFSKLG